MPMAFLNGEPATADDLRALALGNYGHFTSMQVRGGAVQGLDLHLRRLRAATRELFGTELDTVDVQRQAHAALQRAGLSDASLRLTVFSRQFDYRDAGRDVATDLLVSLSPAATQAKPALRVKSYDFVRPLPHIKHVGTFQLFHYRRRALADGFDDALFVGPDGAMVEGSIWNLGLWDGERVVWPDGPALRGVCEQLLQAGLEASGVPQQVRRVALGEAGDFPAAFACNASGIQPVTAIDGVALDADTALMARLQVALDRQPWQPLA
ncbi:aminotransferase class IV family protein [Pseudoxanthomonas putridarboris]|uniref:Aminotransferase class IV family protein n=1 Tax=Pseudoxanthomonas putridarboris TaxID=752605 RepID=A0ABU9IYD9_9GAMM